MWNPSFRMAERRVATLTDYHRRFGIWTTRARGTPKNPGLGLCLEPKPGGRCRGLVYRLEPEHLDDDLPALWEREMVTGVYEPHWLDVTTEVGVVKALCFVIDKGHPQFAPPMSLAEMADIMAGAHGHYGACRDYLASTVSEMAALGIVDHEFETLLRLVDARPTPPNAC